MIGCYWWLIVTTTLGDWHSQYCAYCTLAYDVVVDTDHFFASPLPDITGSNVLTLTWSVVVKPPCISELTLPLLRDDAARLDVRAWLVLLTY